MDPNHKHCKICVTSTCYLTEKCNFIHCPFKCGATYHECKLDDHKTICPQVMVDCINAGYGCSYKLLRKYLGHHLERCPASVVLCTMKWVREVAAENTEVKRVNPSIKINQLDAALAMKDQRTLSNVNEDFSHIEKPSLIMSDEGDFDENLSYEELGLASSKTESMEEQMPQKNVLTLSLESRASTIPEVVWKSKKHVFMCSEPLRRLEFSHHYQNFHSEIQGESSMWLEQRCPLSMYGCNFSQHRLAPVNGFVSYNPYFNQLGIGFNTNYSTELKDSKGLSFSEDYNSMIKAVPLEHIEENGKPWDTDRKGSLSLLDMPDLAFEHILSYLDSFSIKNLSMASQDSEGRCEQFIRDRGIVITKWKRSDHLGGVRWQIEGHKWIYSNCPSKIRKWKFTDNRSVSDHLQKCPFNLRISHTEPELIPISESIKNSRLFSIFCLSQSCQYVYKCFTS